MKKKFYGKQEFLVVAILEASTTLTSSLLSQHFGTRGRQDHHQTRIEELKWVRNADEYRRYM